MDQCGPSTTSKTYKTPSDPECFGVSTAKLLRRITRKVEGDAKLSSSVPLAHVVARTVRYTGLRVDTVETMLATGKPLEIEHIDVDRNLIHKELIAMYLEKKCIPTVTQLFNSTHHALPNYADIDYFKSILIKMGYVIYKYPGQRVLRVLEKKSVTFDRYKYLTSMRQFREACSPIVFIGMATLDSSHEFLNLEKTSRTNNTQTVRHILFTATRRRIDHVNLVQYFSFEVLKIWLINFVLHNLQPGSVIILEDSKIFNKMTVDVPTVYSVKCDIVEWLQAHDIPCDIDMSKLALMDLVESCTNTHENTYILDKIVKSYNHKLLRLPMCINGLSIPALTLRFLNDIIQINETCTDKATKAMFISISPEQLTVFSDCVQKEEMRLTKEDLIVDNNLDVLVRNTKSNIILNDEDNEDDTTVPIFSDSD